VDFFLDSWNLHVKNFYHIANILTSPCCLAIRLESKKQTISMSVSDIFNPVSETKANLEHVRKIVRYNISIINVLAGLSFF